MRPAPVRVLFASRPESWATRPLDGPRAIRDTATRGRGLYVGSHSDHVFDSTPMSPRVPILLYHQVLSSRTPDRAGESSQEQGDLAVELDRFRADMTRLHRRGWHCVSAMRAAELTLAGRRAPRTFAITFDDATRDYGRHAHPILRDLGFAATLFVVTGRLGGRADWEGAANDELLDADELRHFVTEGVELGSHGHTHSRLSECSDGELRSELRESRILLSELGGKPVETIAWPYGAHDLRTRRAAEAAGYRIGFSVSGDGALVDRVRRALSHEQRDPLAVPRREVHGGEPSIRRKLRMGPADGLFVTARKLGSALSFDGVTRSFFSSPPRRSDDRRGM